MTLSTCSREKELVEVLAKGHWPHACPEELRVHVTACRSCADLVLVACAFQSARNHSIASANLPSPGVLWWRAQLRRRNQAIERVGKPILFAQVFALSMVLLLGLGLAVSQARHGLNWLSWLDQLPRLPFGPLDRPALSLSSLFTSGWSLTLLIPALATVAVLGGVVVYLASEKQ
jgi:hypothetical protein